MYFARRSCLLALLATLVLHGADPDVSPTPGLSLWYDRPSEKWTDALPIGNGRMAAMVFGGIDRERLQLNEDTLYSGEPPADLRTINVRKDFDHVMGLLRAGKNSDADAYISKHWLGRNQQCYQPLGDLFLDFGRAASSGEVKDFRRWLDLTNAIAGVSYQRGDVTFTREIFASHPDQVIVIRLRASKPGALSFRVSFASVHPTAKAIVSGDRVLALRGQLPGYVGRRPLKTIEQWGDQHRYPELYDQDGKRRPHTKPYKGNENDGTALYGADNFNKGMRFEALLAAHTNGGKVVAENDALRIEGATEALLLLGAASSFNGFDQSPTQRGVDQTERAVQHVRAAGNQSYSNLRNRHVQDYRALFDRSTLRLTGDATKESLPTDKRIAAFREHPGYRSWERPRASARTAFRGGPGQGTEG